MRRCPARSATRCLPTAAAVIGARDTAVTATCRRRARRAQAAAVGRRHQASEAGKPSHRRRQSAYRERLNAEPITHQGLLPVTCPVRAARPGLNQCLVSVAPAIGITPFERLARVSSIQRSPAAQSANCSNRRVPLRGNASRDERDEPPSGCDHRFPEKSVA